MTPWECNTKMSALLWGQALNVVNLNMRLVQLNKVFYYGNHNFFFTCSVFMCKYLKQFEPPQN